MRYLTVILFHLFLAVSVSAIDFIAPASAINAGGNENGGSGKEKGETITIKSGVFTKNQFARANTVMKNGGSVIIPLINGNRLWFSRKTWFAFAPYEPEILRQFVIHLSLRDYASTKSLTSFLRFWQKNLRRLENKKKLAEKVGTKAQVVIIDKMITIANIQIKFLKADLKKAK